MIYKGLEDPKNKPFGSLLPFEVQVIIMFWTRGFMTNDRRIPNLILAFTLVLTVSDEKPSNTRYV